MTELTEPPASDHLTDHDRAHSKTYFRVLDGVADGSDLAEIARVVLGVNIDGDPECINRLFEAYDGRAVWMAEQGYRGLAGLGRAFWWSPPQASST